MAKRRQRRKEEGETIPRTAKRRQRKREGSRWVTVVAFIPALVLVGLLAYLLSVPPAPLPSGTRTTEGRRQRLRTSSSGSSPLRV